MNLYVIRHGETNYNVENRLQGQIESELTEKGIQQSYMAKEKLENEKIDIIISSPLQRTKKLSEIINEDRKLEIIYINALIERSYGDLEGLSGNDIDINLLWNLDINYSGNNIETVKDFLKRGKKLLNELEEKYSNKNVLCICHSGNSISFNCYYNGMPKDKDLLKLGLENCEIMKYTTK